MTPDFRRGFCCSHIRNAAADRSGDRNNDQAARPPPTCGPSATRSTMVAAGAGNRNSPACLAGSIRRSGESSTASRTSPRRTNWPWKRLWSSVTGLTTRTFSGAILNSLVGNHRPKCLSLKNLKVERKGNGKIWPGTIAWAKWGAWGKQSHLPMRILILCTDCVA